MFPLIVMLLIVTALVTACQQAQGQPSFVSAEGLRYTAQARLVDVAPTRLHATVTLTNVSDKTLQVEYGGCSFAHLLAFDNPARSGVPVWDSAERRDPVTGNPYACELYLVQREVAPGESLSPEALQMLIPTYEIVGHSLLGRFLPDGRYLLVAQVQVNNQTIEIPAGQVTLSMRQSPLPSRRTVDGIVYRMEISTSATSPLTIEVTLTVANTSNRPAQTSIARDCPLALFAYRDLARRDAAYAAGEPDWRPKAICYLHMLTFDLAPGESRKFSTTVTAAEILDNSLPEGRYYLAAVVWLKDRALLLATDDVQLRR